MKALIIRSPWIEKILAGSKTWELRKRPTKIRGRIALIRGGSGMVVGTAELTECIGPMGREELRQAFEKHHAPDATLKELGYEQAYAWVLGSVRPLTPPLRYRHPSGAVIWVDLAQAGVMDEQVGIGG